MTVSNFISLEKVTFKYPKTLTDSLKSVDFEINKGDFIALLGANGAGKSTLLNILSGLLLPTTGNVFYNNENLNKQQPFSSIGFCPQNQVMDWFTSVFDNVLQGPLLAGYNLKESKKLTEEALEIVDLLKVKNKVVDTLSGGQQQRVQVARAIAHKPDFYILDEPTTGLDAESSEGLLTYLSKNLKKIIQQQLFHHMTLVCWRTIVKN